MDFFNYFRVCVRDETSWGGMGPYLECTHEVGNFQRQQPGIIFKDPPNESRTRKPKTI